MKLFFRHLFLLFLLTFTHDATSQNEFLQNGYPVASGVAILDNQANILGYYPVPGTPSDIDVLPSGDQFVVSTTNGTLHLYDGNGNELLQLNFRDLWDVDVLSADEFLLTSRYGNSVFLFNIKNGQQSTLPYQFQGPTDSDLLTNGNILVCDTKANRVIEVRWFGSSARISNSPWTRSVLKTVTR